MKTSILASLLLLFLTNTRLHAQLYTTQKPQKTGNEWRMPTDITKHAHAYSDSLQKLLGLDQAQTKKVFDAYIANSKSVDEISVLPASEKEKQAELKANKAAFDDKLKNIMTTDQFSRYLRH